MVKYTSFYNEMIREKKKSIEYYTHCIKCEKCGHTIYIGNRDKVLCTSCGRYLFKDKKKEFDYRMRTLL